jgi:putative spermidine/putrescine transport system permease protein
VPDSADVGLPASQIPIPTQPETHDVTATITEEDAPIDAGGKQGVAASIGRTAAALASYLQAVPLTLILGFFFLLPILMIAVVSFWDYDFASLYPDFLTTNYTDTLGSWVTWKTYLNTLKYTALVWGLTLLIGFWIAYFWPSMSALRRCRWCCSSSARCHS